MIKIYDTLTRQKKEFLPPGSRVRMFVCGPTVYDFSHVGHARTYVAYDTIARYLRYRGYDVFYLQNITDIDDKIIERARQKEQNPAELAQEYKEAYFEDMKKIGISSVSEYAPATQYIPEIVGQVKRLVGKGIAYLIKNDGYYFDLAKFPDYGKLSGRTTEAAEDATSRIDEGIDKKNKGDFALWKFSKPEETGWDTEFGYGRPGWHIEDTAITEKHFGSQYDLHGGARDLMFPHHEAEIAQMESVSGKRPFVNYWVHTGFLTIGGQKMSKSLHNFITIRDVLQKYTPETLRLMFLMTHYRSPIDYSEKNIKQAEAAMARIGEFIGRLQHFQDTSKNILLSDKTEAFKNISREIITALDDDFDAPRAIALLFDYIHAANQEIDDGKLPPELEVWKIFGDVLAILPPSSAKSKLPDDITALVNEREQVRGQKDFARADQLREQIQELGYTIDDTNYGPLVKKS
ncbi:MAG: cysteine--tRNA ligase [Candidatus Yanofskybacteria bacterium]|nr:cysteine--tRNA ligase [Candidatus Yanofskybacteria bacterium]